MSQNPPPVQLILSAKDETRAAIQSAVGGLEQLKSSAAGLQGLLAGAPAALAGLAAVQQFRNFVSAAAAMDDLAEKTGASVEKLSALASVAKISGTSIDVVENSLVRLAKGLAGADEESKGAGNALAALGLKAEELKKLDTADALKLVADRLNEYRDGAGKTALAVDLLGKSGAQALPYLKDLAETSNLQAKLTAEQAAQAENLEKNLVRLSASTSGAWKEFSAAVLPTVDQFVQALLEASNKSGGLRDEIKKLAADGTIRDWAENAAIGVAYLIDAARNLVNVLNVAGASTATAFVGAELSVAKVRQFLDGGRNARYFDQQVKDLRALKSEAESGVSEAFQKFLDAPQFSNAVRDRFTALRSAAQTASETKPQIDYNSNVGKAAGAAKDELKSIESYVASIREQVVGVTAGEFEKMRQKALDTFSAVDFGALSGLDKSRFSDAFAQVTEDIDALEERTRTMQWAKALSDGFVEAARAAEAADLAFSGFNQAMSQQAQDLQFEISLVGKLADERRQLAAIRKIDADALRAQAAIPDNAPNREERIGDIQREAENAKQRVTELNTQLRTLSRDGFTGLQSAAAEYFSRVTNDASNFGNAFTNIMGSVENSFVELAKTGKFEFKGLVNSIIADLARIVVRQQITAPLAKAVNDAAGGGLGGLFSGLFGNSSSGSFTGDSALDIAIGLRASGGPVDAGSPYIVGEKGPELFVPNLAGSIVPNSAMGGVSIVQNINIDSRSDQASILQAMTVAKNEAVAEIEDRRRRTGGMA